MWEAAPEPVMDARLSQLCVTLRGEDIRACGITTTKAKIVVERVSGFVEEVNITKLLPFVSHMEPTNLGSDMGMLHA